MAVRDRCRPSGQRHRVLDSLVRELPPELRSVRLAVLTETLAAGVPVDPSALTIVLGAHLQDSGTPLLFTRAGVEELLWAGIATFCTESDVPLPDRAVDALHALLAVVVRRELLAPGSDATAELFAPFRELTSAPPAPAPLLSS